MGLHQRDRSETLAARSSRYECKRTEAAAGARLRGGEPVWPYHTLKAFCSKACNRSGFVVMGGAAVMSPKFRVDDDEAKNSC